MKKLYSMPQNIVSKKPTLPMDISGPFEMADLRKSQVSNTEISREISQINQQLTPRGHKNLV